MGFKGLFVVFFPFGASSSYDRMMWLAVHRGVRFDQVNRQGRAGPCHVVCVVDTAPPMLFGKRKSPVHNASGFGGAEIS